MKMFRTDESAVSPVVGVMLMLVVTIIIAAVVAAFAGGLGASQKTAPQASISAEFSQTDGLTIWHDGGDTLTTVEFQILLTPSKNLGATSDIYTEVINKSILRDAAGDAWVEDDGGIAVPRFVAGDVAYVPVENCGTDLTPHLPSYSTMLASSKVGGSFYLDFVTNDGKKITTIEVPIRP